MIRILFNFLALITVIFWFIAAQRELDKFSRLMRPAKLSLAVQFPEIHNGTGTSNETFYGPSPAEIQRSNDTNLASSEVDLGLTVLGISKSEKIIFIRSKWSDYYSIEILILQILLIIGMLFILFTSLKPRRVLDSPLKYLFRCVRIVFCSLGILYCLWLFVLFPITFKSHYNSLEFTNGDSLTNAIKAQTGYSKLHADAILPMQDTLMSKAKFASYERSRDVFYGIASIEGQDERMYIPFSITPRRRPIELFAIVPFVLIYIHFVCWRRYS